MGLYIYNILVQSIFYLVYNLSLMHGLGTTGSLQVTNELQLTLAYGRINKTSFQLTR